MRKNLVIGRERTALVAGGSSGIGLAIARLLAQQGNHVWLVARRADQLSAALAAVKAACPYKDQRCGTVSADVSDPHQALAAAEQVIAEVGPPHLLVNSAGVARPGTLHELSLDDFHWMMEVNYFGTVNMVKATLPGMSARGWGYIVNISSVAGFMGIFGYSAYSASKFAVTGFSEVLRAELKPKGIGVSIVFPPDVDTPQLAYESQFRPAETRAIVEGKPVLTPEAVAVAVLRGIQRKRFVILPSAFEKTIYTLTHLLDGVRYPILDWMASRTSNHPDGSH